MGTGRKIQEIEMLRGVAILATLGTHVHNTLMPDPSRWWDHLSSNYVELWWGVDLFFAISGYVIARSLLPSIAQARSVDAFVATAAIFWVRRAWRLIPSAWLWLAISLALAATFGATGLSDTFHTNFLSVVAGVLCVANFHFAATLENHAGYGITSVYWSLSLEEQFYLLLPVVALLAGKRVGLAIGLCACVLFCFPHSTPLMIFRIHAALLGVLLAIAERQPVWRDLAPTALAGRRLGRALMLGLPVLLMGALAANNVSITRYMIDLIAILSAILVWVASYDSGLLMADGRLRRTLSLLGNRSYGLYLVHVPAFVTAHVVWLRITGKDHGYGAAGDLALIAFGLLLAVSASELNHRLVEAPLRDRGKAIARRMQLRIAARASGPAVVRSLAVQEVCLPSQP